MEQIYNVAKTLIQYDPIMEGQLKHFFLRVLSFQNWKE